MNSSQRDAALRASEQKLRGLFELSPVGIALTDMAGRYVEFNEAFRKITGYTADELRALDYWTLTPKRFEAAEAQQLEQLDRTGHYGPYEKEYIRKDGSLVPLRLNGMLLKDEAGRQLIWSIVEDVTAAKAAEHAMARERLRLETILRTSADGMHVIDATGLLVEANDAFLRMIGYDRSAIGRLHVVDWDAEQHPESIRQRIAAIMHSPELVVFETLHRHRDGHVFGVEINACGIALDGQRFVYASSRDITARREADSALRESETKFRTLFETAHDAIFIMEGRAFLLCNPRSLAMFGCTEADLRGRSPIDFSPALQPDGRPSEEKAKELIDHAMQGRPQSFEWQHRRLDGTLFDAEVSLNRVEVGGQRRLQAIVRDVTERKRAEAAQRLLATAVEQATESIVITDAHGTIRFANPAFERSTGYTRAEALGQNPRILKSGKQGEDFYRAMWSVLARGDAWQGRFENRRKDGTTYEEDATISPVRDAMGQVINYVAVKRDVSRELQLEAQLRQAQKLEAIGQLAGGVAHDFNNLLGVIIGNCEMALLALDESQDVRANLKEIHDASTRSADLTRQLLTFARKQDVVPRVLDLNRTVKHSLRMLKRLIGEDIELQWQPGDDIWPISMDPTVFDQLLANLCVNARDAIADTGTLTIATQNEEASAALCERCPDARLVDYVRLTIADDGSGMAPDVVAHIFEPFFTTKGIGRGTGLGLATVYGAVRQNGGCVEVRSEPRVGTTFEIYLPRHHATAAAAGKPEPSPADASGRETILVVEDQDALLALITNALKDRGYRVLSARRPLDAIRLSNEHVGQIDLLLTDVIMPELNGWNLARTLTALRPTLKCLFMTGFAGDRPGSAEALGDETRLIRKPFALTALAAKVREVLDEAGGGGASVSGS